MNLYYTVGIPGSGKTSFVNKYLLRLNIHYINGDILRQSIGLQRKQLWDYMLEETKIKLEKKDVVVDNTHFLKFFRNKFVSFARENNHKIICIYFDIPLEVCLERNSKREGTNRVPNYIIEQMYKKLQIPLKNEYDELWTISY